MAAVRERMGVVIVALMLLAFGNAVFFVVRGLALPREGRVDERLQAVVWSRLISLPAPFFRRFTAGDGAARANGNQRHPPDVDRHRGAGRNQRPLLDVQPRAALLLLLPLGLAVTTCVFSYGRVRHYRDVFRMQGAIDGFVLQMINGVAKLRVANAESHALAHLGEPLLRAETSVSSGAALGRGAARGHGHVQPLALGAIYEVVYYGGPTGGVPAMGLAAFLSFNAAFGQLTAAVNSLTIALTTSFGTVPLPSEWPGRGRKIRG